MERADTWSNTTAPALKATLPATGGANDIVFRKSQAYSYADSSNLLKLSMNMVSVNKSSDEASSAVRGRRRF